jgi:hypothetical protein
MLVREMRPGDELVATPRPEASRARVA